MKKKFCVSFLAIILMFGVLFNLSNAFFYDNKSLSADSLEITADKFEDRSLYNYLCLASNSTVLTPNSLQNIAKLVDASDQQSGYKLDLSYAFINNQALSTTKYSFTSLKGLELFSFNTEFFITELNLSGHKLTSINTYLNNFTKLKTLNLSYNNLSTINLSNIKSLQTVDLSNNNFNNIQDIVLYEPQQDEVISEKREVYLSYNNLTDYINSENTTINYNFGVQGVKNNGIYYLSAEVGFKSYIDKITKIEIKKQTDSESNEWSTFATLPFVDNETNETINKISLPFGVYKIEFTEKDGFIPSDMPASQYRYVDDITFSVKVPAPVFKFYQEEQEVPRTINIYTPTTIKFDGVGELHILVNGEEVTGNSVYISTYGTSLISYYQIVDGVKSDIQEITVVCKISNGLSFLYILLTFLGFALLCLIGYVLYKKVYLKQLFHNKTDKKEKF